MRQFGHKRPVRDEQKKIVQWKDSPVCAITRGTLGGQFGRDKNHRLVVVLAAGDVIAMRPAKTKRTVTGTAQDVYRYLLRCAVNAFHHKVKDYKKTMSLKAARRKARQELGL